MNRLSVLLGGVLLFVLSGSAAWAEPSKEIGAAVLRNQEDQVKTTQALIKIEAYNQITPDYSGPYPAQGVVDSLNFVMEKAKEMGFKTVLHKWEGTKDARGPLYGYAEYGPEDAPEMIMALGHLDTVPPGNADLWTLGGPYEAKIVKIGGEDHIVGRGAFDDKGPALAALYSMKALKDSGIPLKRRIRVFFGTTEDYGGWKCVDAYAADATAGREEWPVLGFSPDSGTFQPTYIEKSSVNVAARVPVDNDKNAVKLTALNGGTARNAVSDRCQATLEGGAADLAKVKEAMEKAIADKGWDMKAQPIAFDLADGKLKIDVTGRAAHSGWAWEGIGANNRMAYLLSVVPLETDWKAAAGKITALLPPDENKDNMGTALGVREGGLEYSDIVTVNMGLLRLEDAEKGGKQITFAVNIRYPDKGADVLTGTKHQSGEEIKAKVDAKFKEAGLTAAVTGGAYPYTVPMDSEIIVKLQKAYRDITGKEVTPCITNGGTYAAAWRNAKLSEKGDATFGFRMVSWGIDGGIGMHEANESISVPKLIEGTQVMALAMAYLATE